MTLTSMVRCRRRSPICVLAEPTASQRPVPTNPFHAGHKPWFGLQERGDYCVATSGGCAELPQCGSAVYQATEQWNRPRTQGGRVCVKEGGEFSPCLLGGVDRDRLTLGDVSKRDITAPVEVLEAGGLVGVIDEPRRRRVEVAAAAVAVHEQVLTSGQREVLSLVDLLEIEGDYGLAGDEVSIGVDTFAREVSLADPDIGHSQSLLRRHCVDGPAVTETVFSQADPPAG
jgi:hypothetical protein